MTAGLVFAGIRYPRGVNPLRFVLALAAVAALAALLLSGGAFAVVALVAVGIVGFAAVFLRSVLRSR